MVTQRTRKIIIRAIIALFLLSSGLTFLPYLISSSATPETIEDPSNLEEYIDLESNVEVISPNQEINVDTPEENDVQIVVNEDETKNEQGQPVIVPLPNGGSEEIVTTDLTDTLQVSN